MSDATTRAIIEARTRLANCRMMIGDEHARLTYGDSYIARLGEIQAATEVQLNVLMRALSVSDQLDLLKHDRAMADQRIGRSGNERYDAADEAMRLDAEIMRLEAQYERE